MNIKKIEFISKKKLILSLFFIVIAVLSLGFADQVSAQPQTSGVLKHCEKKAKKAKNACPEAVKQAINIASYNCDKAKKPDSCMLAKAKAYITKAAKGNPSESKFKSNLSDVLKDQEGDKTKFNSSVGASSTNGASVFATSSGGGYICGNMKDNSKNLETNFNFGCLGPEAPDGTGPIQDLAYAIIRFMSVGVGIALVASIVYAGIQYSAAEGNPEATQASKNRIRDAFIGLLVYIFAFTILQYLVPGGVFAGVIVPPVDTINSLGLIK